MENDKLRLSDEQMRGIIKDNLRLLSDPEKAVELLFRVADAAVSHYQSLLAEQTPEGLTEQIAKQLCTIPDNCMPCVECWVKAGKLMAVVLPAIEAAYQRGLHKQVVHSHQTRVQHINEINALRSQNKLK